MKKSEKKKKTRRNQNMWKEVQSYKEKIKNKMIMKPVDKTERMNDDLDFTTELEKNDVPSYCNIKEV